MTDRKIGLAAAQDVFALARREIAERDTHIAELTKRVAELEAQLRTATRIASDAERALCEMKARFN